MQLTVAEDLLRNTENLAVAFGDVLGATSGNNSMTINQTNIGKCIKMYTYILCICMYIHTV